MPDHACTYTVTSTDNHFILTCPCGKSKMVKRTPKLTAAPKMADEGQCAECLAHDGAHTQNCSLYAWKQ